jgi:hypothetical protein
VQEAEALITDHSNSIFNYGTELLRIAAAGRSRLAGGDALDGATEAAGRMWEKLWRPDSYAGTQTWESRFPRSIQRGGILGTVRGFANHLIGHFAQRLRKSRASVSTFQRSQIDEPMEPASRPSYQEGEWQAWKAAIIGELVKALHDEMASEGGKHWESRVRNLRWAIAIVDKQMAYPFQWRSMPEVMAEIPGLQGIPRGGLQQELKNLIDRARMQAVKRLGTEKEQAVAYGLQRRRQRSLGQTEGKILPSLPGDSRMTNSTVFSLIPPSRGRRRESGLAPSLHHALIESFAPPLPIRH